MQSQKPPSLKLFVLVAVLLTVAFVGAALVRAQTQTPVQQKVDEIEAAVNTHSSTLGRLLEELRALLAPPPPPPCTFTIAPTSRDVVAGGGSGSVAVTASAATCAWTAASAETWVTVQGGSGTGSGSVSYSVAPNPSAQRTGVLSIAGQTFEVLQAAAPPPPPPPTGITPLYRFSCSAATWPACGLNLVPDNQYHRRTFMATGGPGGRSATLWEHLPADHHFQYYWGWGTIPGLALVPQGAARYFRGRIYVEPGTDLSGNQGPWETKFFIVADGQNMGSNRIVGHAGVGNRNNTDFYLGAGRNIDGGIYQVPRYLVTPGMWHHFEYEFQSSSTASAANGRIRLRVNGGPWLESGQFVFTTQGWNTFALGRIAHTTLRAGSRLALRIANDWELDDAPDPTWHTR